MGKWYGILSLLFHWGGFGISLRGRQSELFICAVTEMVKGYVAAFSFTVFEGNVDLLRPLPSKNLSSLLSLSPTRQRALPPRCLNVLRLNSFTLLPNLPPTTSSRCIDDDPLARLHTSRVLPPQIDIPLHPFLRILAMPSLLYLPHPVINPTRRVLPTRESIRMIHPPLTQDTRLHRDPELDIPDDAFTPGMLSAPCTSLPESEMP